MIPVFLALWVATAHADPLDALDLAARGFYARAEEQEAAGRFGSAASFYRLVLEHDPGFVPALLGYGRALEAQGLRAEAERLYREQPSDPDVIEALATLIEAEHPDEALSLWRQLEIAHLGDPTPFLHQARLLLRGADLAAARGAWETYVTLLQGSEPDGATLLALADADPAGAEPLLRAYVELFPEGGQAAEVHQRLDRLELEAAAALVDLGADEPLTAELTALAVRVEAALAQGDVVTATAVAGELVTRAPGSSQAHGAYADALAAGGAWSEAEVQARIARRLAPDDAGARARLGRLLADAYGGRGNAEALDELVAACRLRSGDAALRFQLAEVQQATLRFDDAVASYRAVLSADPHGEWAAPAAERLVALTRDVPELPPLAAGAAPPVSPEAIYHWKLANELLRRGRRPEAEAELDLALAAEPTFPRLLNVRAALYNEAGQRAEAVALWKRSLGAAPDQPDVWRNLAGVATDRAEASACLREAAALGDADASYLLAKQARDIGDWSTAESELDAYEATASLGSGSREAARALRTEIEGRQRAFIGLGLAVGVVGVGAPAVWWWRRRSGRTLRELLTAIPENWHEAARYLAAIRHEVLKHNTTVLPEVAAAIETGDLAPWEALSQRLPELSDKLHAYEDALITLGRTRGVRFVPELDPTVGPLNRAFARLLRIRRPDPDELLDLSRIINEDAYVALGAIVREICVLRCDEALVREVYQRVCAEPGFAGAPLPDLWVTGDTLTLRLFRPDLEDILANLLRNALSAGATTVAVSLADTEDEVTGHPLAEIAIIDDAPGTLTNAMIRSRFIGRGLGLAVDLTNRHGGSIRVDSRAEGAKAVVVQFQLAEGGGE